MLKQISTWEPFKHFIFTSLKQYFSPPFYFVRYQRFLETIFKRVKTFHPTTQKIFSLLFLLH